MRGSLLRAAVVALLISVVTVGQAGAQEPPRPGGQPLFDELGKGRVARHSQTGQLRFAGGTARQPSASGARLGRPPNARAAARAYVARYGRLFGIRDAARDVRVERSLSDGRGRTFVRLQQVQAGVPVLAGELTLQVDDAGSVISALGEMSASSQVDVRPTITADAAETAALEATARARGVELAELQASPPALWIYDPALLRSDSQSERRLVWRTEVRGAGGEVNEFVLIDAHAGTVVLQFSQHAHARNRRVCDARKMDAQVGCTTAARTETSGSSSVAEVNRAFDYMGQTYDFFQGRFGRDSFDGSGGQLRATVRYCGGNNCAALNAYWDGQQAYFWPGLARDDVVAHEFVHAYTQHSSDLVYAFQSGAINEALSDIFGEFVDLTNSAGNDAPEVRWLIGEDVFAGGLRNMKHPPALGHPDRMQSPYYTTDAEWTDNGGVHHNSGVANKAAFLMVDGESFNGQTISGIGIDKAAAVWYRAAFNYLASGSDFEDLGLALTQACADLQGTSVKNNSGASSGTIAGADCSQVAKAVEATEMAMQPSSPGAAVPEAPLCDVGAPVDVFLDQFTSSLGAWTANNSRWRRDTFYATSRPGHLWGRTPAEVGGGNIERAAVTLPPEAYLHFRHAHLFDWDLKGNYDGGRLSYRVNSGSWQDAEPLFTHNGYTGTISSDYGNPLGGLPGFTGESWGYYSSRLDLSSLAGQSVGFRFRVGSDDYVDFGGWHIDDVRLYTCSTHPPDTMPPSVTPPNANLRSGVAVGEGSKPVKVNVSFSASDESGIAATALQKRANSGSYSGVSLSSATATAANQKFPTSGSTRRQFRARATDAAGNTSAWATADAFRVLAHQNGSAAVVQSGSWKTASKSSFYGGSVRHSASAGASQSRSATVADFAIVSTLGPNRGQAEVWLDGVLHSTIDLYASSLQYRRVVFAIDFGTPGTHTIELRATGTKNPQSSGSRVDFDAFLALAP